MFKLVYSKVLNMYVPASEAVRSHAGKSRRIRKHAKHSFGFVLIVINFHAANSFADTVTAVDLQKAVNATVQSAVNSTIVKQTSSKAILDWNRLNIAKGYTLKFDQQGNRTWSALNRIHDLSPTILNGNVQADGNVYFINTNGIIFGADSQFNVGSLYAGTLDITDRLFNDGFINSDATFKSVFEAVGAISTGSLTVEKGANITTATNGKVVLFSENIENSGVINTPDGQTILAAGKKIYLASSKDPAGFMVEVDGGGTVTNLGKIVAERGNITMMGLAVNQKGTLTATTSVRANGSIHLLAQDHVDVSGVSVVVGKRNGLVTLAEDSITEVNPEYADKEETIASQAFNTSQVKVEASLVNIDGKISVKGGNVTVNAINPASAELNSQNSSRIFLGDHASIDVSGVDATAPMSRNQLEIQLFSDAFKDDPILRGSGLYKETVYVDARKGTSLFDIAPYLALKGATVAEKMTKAGNITLSTPDDLIVSKNATLNISGGSTTYEAGAIKETNLVYNGKLVPISEAKTGVRYEKTADVYIVKDSRWGVTRSWDLSGGGTAGWGKKTTGITTSQLKTSIVGSFINDYLEGDDAGALDLTVHDDKVITQNLVLAGNVIANTKIGAEQLATQQAPLGGKVIASANDLVISKVATSVVADIAFDQQLPDSENFKSWFSPDLLANGINRLDLTKTNHMVVNDEMRFQPNGSFTLNGHLATDSAEINANIIAPSGNINLKGITTVVDGVTISTAGNFTNDRANVGGSTSQIAAVNGGSITGNLLNFGHNVTLDASAGAWVNNNGILKEGDAGNIKFGTATSIDNSVTLKSYGFKQGGALAVTFGTGTQTLNVAGNPNASDSDIDVESGFFTKGGFSSYSLSAFNVNIGDNSAPQKEIYTSAQTLRMNSGFANQASGQPISVVSSLLEAPDASRMPVSLSFSAGKLGGVMTLAENTTLRTDRGGSVSLDAGMQLNVLGDITTPSGTINLKITEDAQQSETQAQTIFIGEKAKLSAAGSSVALPDSQSSLLKTQVFNAGNININQPSQIQNGAVIIKNGAVLDVSGASIENDTKTAAGYVRETLHGDAGTISIKAVGSLLLDGDFKAATTGTGRNGTLDLVSTAPTFTISQEKKLVAENFSAGNSLTADDAKAQISAEQIKKAGFANLNVKSYVAAGLGDSIALANGLDLNIAANLRLDTSTLNIKDDGIAKLTASHITLKSANIAVDPASVALGNGKLTTQSKQLFVDGLVAISGVKETQINTSLDVSGKGTNVTNGDVAATQGGIIANGDIIVTARQIYPSTNAKFGIEAVSGKITINSNGAVAKPVLSAGGMLSLKGADVVQNGVITAPFGQIDIETTNSATFTKGSVTSVSANNQIIPYGVTTTGGELFNTKSGNSTPLLDKNITIKSSKVDLQKDAIVDLSAGGDLFAYEWVPGIGGSKDTLAQANTYAVMPSLGQDYAAFDQVYTDSSAQVGVGQSVYLSGVPGLAAGNYTLLPAHYALVPGAFLVEAKVTGSNLLPGQSVTQLDGGTLTTGYMSELATGAHDATWSTFKVTDGAIFRPATGTVSKAPSQYLLTSATTFFSNPLKTNGQEVSLPLDVGKLGLDATKLTLDATVVANKKAGGSGLQVDISSSNIRVVSSTGADDGSLQLTADSINALNAESLLLGGSRTLQNGVVNVTSSADAVSVENDSNHVIKVPEFIATALNSVTVKTGAAVNTGAAAKSPAKKVINTNDDGALLALSSSSDITYSRTGGSPTSTQGELNVEDGSILKAGNSVVLDATKSANLKGKVALQDGGSATLGANRILIGNAPIDILGLNVNAAALSALGQLKALTLNSYNNIDTYGAVNIGNANLDLTMNAAGIVGHPAQGEVTVPTNAAASVITARNFTIKNTQNAAFTASHDPSGRSLEINATNVKFDGGLVNSGKTNIDGFNNLEVKSDEIRVSNLGEMNFNVAEAKLTTTRLTADTAANYKITSTGELEIAKPATDTNNKISNGFGAQLAVSANDLKISGNIDLSSGVLALTSTHDLNIESGAVIRAASTANTFYDKTVHASAGSVTLTSTTANVNLNTGALVDVTSRGEANAGLVKVVAKSGTANIAGQLNGAAAGTGKGGVLDVDVNTLTDLTTTNKQARGFSEGRQYRVRTGDVSITGSIANGNELAAREVMVSADAGNIAVSGDIIATAPKNSRIGLFAGNGVTLNSTANLKANSTKAGEEGGKVDIETTAGPLDFKAGSKVNAAGAAGAKDGQVYLGAARTADNLDINVANMGTTFTGARKIDIGGLGSIETDKVNTANQTTAFNKAEAFMKSVIADSTKGLQRLGLTGDERFAIVPVVEFKNTNQSLSNGKLTLADTFDLHTWRFDPITGERVVDQSQLVSGVNADGKTLLAGVLNLRAKGDVIINATLSDGFSNADLKLASKAGAAAIPAELDADGNEITAEVPAVQATGVQGIESWSYRIVAGADFSAANALATSSAGNINVAASKGIRTGTGSINVAAGGDLKMGNASSVIYTVGRNAATLAGFDLPGSNLAPLYLTDGGDINITVQGNVIGAESVSGGRQLINQWLFRQGGSGKDTSWWVRPDLFQQSTATLGGGDVVINAGGNISNFSASAATTARFNTNENNGKQSVNGGGDLKVKAGGDIANGIYFVAKGDGDINAAGSIQKQGNTFGTLLALQDGGFNVGAGKNSYIETVINPTLIASSKDDAEGKKAYFNSYSPQTKVSTSSLIGNAEFGTGKLSDISQKVVGLDTTATATSLKYTPASLSVVSHNADVTVGGTAEMTLLPSSTGNFKVVAANNVNLGNVLMSDADPAILPNINKPITVIDFKSFADNPPSPMKGHSLQVLHKNDVEPAIVVAQNGNISPIKQNGSDSLFEDITITLPKETKLYAGKDIERIKLIFQNNLASDIALLKAGNDIKVGNVTVSGPGELLIQAGRNIDLSVSQADIATTGNVNNTALPIESASITLQAGLGNGAAVQTYIDKYIHPTGTGPANLIADAATLADYRASTALALTSYMRKTTGNTTLTDAEALALFNGLNLEAKTIFVNRHLTSELIASAKGFAKAGNHDRGNSALVTLFPNANKGDILLYASKVTTSSGGSIDLIAPGGLINVGAPGKRFKDEVGQIGDIGVITEKGGEIRAIADGDFQVNQSKLITQYGSDIAIWSTKGTIDAGRGSKTATSVPERIVLTDASGNTTIEVKGVAAGSGIRAQTYDPDGLNGPKKAPKKGSIYLTAPTVDAGEAGIEAGDLLIVAPLVLNAANIQVSGSSSGVPVAATGAVGPVGAGLSSDSVNAAVAQVAQAVAQSANQTFVKPSLPSIISVDIIGIGK